MMEHRIFLNTKNAKITQKPRKIPMQILYFFLRLSRNFRVFRVQI